MDTIFTKIDHTMSLPGMQYLYYILRRPLFKENPLNKRYEIIDRLRNNSDISQGIQYYLSILGKEEGKEIFAYFEEGMNVDTNYSTLYQILSYIPFLSLILLLINLRIGFAIFILTFMVNTVVYNSNKHKIYAEMETFKYLGNLIYCAENIMKLNIDSLGLNQNSLEELLQNTKKIKRNISKINFNDELKTEAQLLIDYYNMIVLREPKVFYRVVKQLNENKEDFLKMYTIVGEIDAYISVSSYTSGLDYFIKPKLRKENCRFYLEVDKMYHPLLEKPVPYTFEFNNKGVLITGSNASGKSTFLRTIGINSIFAQTLNIVLAKGYTSSYFRLFTSIGTTDSIVEGDSYFMAEAKALKRIIDSIASDEPILCILDEIFRGTNTAERISAASVVLNYMINNNSCVIAATHDLELISLVNNKYENYHFKETIKSKDIIFDYILRKGPCVSRNAIAILEYLDYPSEIYEKALVQVENYSIISNK
ncbi:DNA mismatch repair protein MutS domain protein [[Clostridium] ultunense Esp]|uniref:DNA mismatch repair protein MutS domain protein n=2 Tax=Schnuerera ultunensis TaxID=45497 RepID=M1ZDC6_9FIRM|nr:DNA mismatch repair protein MutS domain protein [Schnuerera ultunensis]CCQ95908.1 DNA mismatch repair protein MutS domain protein [[Clostridium] ultunense Esp]SHD77983.1 DNA mismatch repair protein MutS domain protein [[Clostridium] ultunense Esp]